MAYHILLINKIRLVSPPNDNNQVRVEGGPLTIYIYIYIYIHVYYFVSVYIQYISFVFVYGCMYSVCIYIYTIIYNYIHIMIMCVCHVSIHAYSIYIHQKNTVDTYCRYIIKDLWWKLDSRAKFRQSRRETLWSLARDYQCWNGTCIRLCAV